MIWLFKVDEVFWNNTPKINDYYTFDTNDVEFDITQYDISLYFPTADYYLHSDSNMEEIYQLNFVGMYKNPMRTLVSKDSEIYNIIREFHIKMRDDKLDLLLT
jgi:hypothetical protein